ncbi:MAG: hypothetical protein RL563_931, partial [Pseudomonadota bacterium]
MFSNRLLRSRIRLNLPFLILFMIVGCSQPTEHPNQMDTHEVITPIV